MAAADTGSWKPSKPEHPSDRIIKEFPDCTRSSSLLNANNDLVHVVRELHSVGLAAKWRQIGQTLKVSNDVMTGLRGDPSVCLLHVVYNWLSGQTRLLDRDQPSWWRVVWVVADKLGGNKQRSAREIAKKCSEQCLGGQPNFVPSTAHAKDAPNTSVLECALYHSDDESESIENARDGLREDLSAVTSRWMQIGVFLGVEFSFLEDMIYTEDSGQNLRNTLENWLQSQIFEITIRRLVEAIEHAGGGNNPILAATIKANLTGTECGAAPAPLGGGDAVAPPAPPKRGDNATLPLLNDFPGKNGNFSVTQRIGVNYQLFGIGLLDDINGDKVAPIVLRHQLNSVPITLDILMEWIRGRGIPDRTWGGLISVLRQPGLVLTALIDDIENVVGTE